MPISNDNSNNNDNNNNLIIELKSTLKRVDHVHFIKSITTSSLDPNDDDDEMFWAHFHKIMYI